jgi:sorbitol-specific phosphotransferase system component IIC
MKRLTLSVKERRLVIILMLVNFFALFVNYFGIAPSVKNEKGYSLIFILTTNCIVDDNDISPFEFQHEINHQNFFPIVKFYTESRYFGTHFKGLFPYYDFSEFFVYTLVIFGIVILRKIW